MDYKISIHGRNFYKEVKLTQDWKKGLYIGTTKECQMRFARESFHTEFVIQILSQNGQWTAQGDSRIYLRKQNADVESILYLMPLDLISVYDASSHAELFQMEFSIDFVNKTLNYDKRILCQGYYDILIGGVQGCTVRVTDPVLGGDYIRFVHTTNGWLIDTRYARYGIFINGFPNRSSQAELHEQDIITINGFSFYWKNACLYTAAETEIITALPMDVIRRQKNHLQYPKFVRSARQQFVIPKEKIDILSPKSKPEEPKKNLVMTMVPMPVHHKLSNLMFNLPDCIICGVVVNRRSHRYASFLRLAYETIILR